MTYKRGFILSGLTSLIGLITFAPADMSGIGSIVPAGSSTHNGQQVQQSSGGGGDDFGHGHVPLFGQESNQQQEDDDVFAMFKQTDEDGNPIEDDGELDDTIESDGELATIPQEQIQQLQTDIRNAISNMRIPENAIPADFDANDRGQLGALLNTTVQSAVSQVMGIVFKPMQIALAHQTTQMQQLMDNKLKASTTQNSARSVIESMVPEINDPKHRDLVTMLDDGLKAKGKKPKERALAIRKTLNKMGFKAPTGSNRRMSGPGTSSNGSLDQQTKFGTDALDSLFGKVPAQK